jgi:hypothetical protein
MKIAVIVYGDYRQFDIAHKSWYKLINCGSDFYISSTPKTIQKNERFGIDIEFDVNEDMFTKYIPNAVVTLNNNNSTYVRFYMNHIIEHWKIGLDMIKKSGKKYDMLMVLRTDSWIDFNITIKELYEYNDKDRLYGSKNILIVGDNIHYMDDDFLFGDYNTFSNFIEGLPEKMCAHDEFAKYTMSKKLWVYDSGIISYYLRPTMISKSLTINNIKKTHNEWLKYNN